VDNQEIAAFAETIPFGSINVCEYRSVINGKILAINKGIKQLHTRLDSKLVVDLECGAAKCEALEVLLIYSQS